MTQHQAHHIIYSIITITGGLIGGLTACLQYIQVQNFLTVCFYSAVSALISYGIKVGMDAMLAWWKKRKEKKNADKTPDKL